MTPGLPCQNEQRHEVVRNGGIQNMRIVDGHSHMYQDRADVGKLKRSVTEIEGFDINRLLERLD